MSRLPFLAVLVCLVSLLLCVPTAADVPADLITDLPGYGKTPSAQYSGYLAADDAETVMLHYWFVTSTGNPKTDPVSVWMNGGPGASSLEGFLTELGPFYLDGNTTADGYPQLIDNPNAWTTLSSIIFLEQPAGVGFSYAKNGSVASDDYVQSQNTYGFLLNFFKAYPEFAKNDFFVTGESYAGIYVPTLANRIVDGNAAGKPYINLKGIAVGDGCTGSRVGTCGEGPDVEAANTYIAVEQLHGHGMISQVAYDNVSMQCGDWKEPSDGCLTTANAAVRSVGRYDVYALQRSSHTRRAVYCWCRCTDAVALWLCAVCCSYDIYNPCVAIRNRTGGQQPMLRAPNKLYEQQMVGDAYPCWIGTNFEAYLNISAVRKAIHTEQTPCPYCGRIRYTSNLPSLLPTYPKLIANMNVLIYSGLQLTRTLSRLSTLLASTALTVAVPRFLLCFPGQVTPTCACRGWTPTTVRPTSPSTPHSSRAAVTTALTHVDVCVVECAGTRSLGLPETQPWRPWRVEAAGRRWTGGFLTQWGSNFTFLTIKHAGHMVSSPPHRTSPTRTPLRAEHSAHLVCSARACCVVCRCRWWSRRPPSRSTRHSSRATSPPRADQSRGKTEGGDARECRD